MLVEHLPGEPTSFHVIPFSEPKNQIKLTAKSKDQKRLWANQIKRVMLEHFDIPSRAKELVFKLGDEEGKNFNYFFLLNVFFVQNIPVVNKISHYFSYSLFIQSKIMNKSCGTSWGYIISLVSKVNTILLNAVKFRFLFVFIFFLYPPPSFHSFLDSLV